MIFVFAVIVGMVGRKFDFGEGSGLEFSIYGMIMPNWKRLLIEVDEEIERQMVDPIKDIEDRKAWMDFGKQAYLIYLGAKEEGASQQDAIKMVAAFYSGMIRGSQPNEEDET